MLDSITIMRLPFIVLASLPGWAANERAEARIRIFKTYADPGYELVGSGSPAIVSTKATGACA